MSPALQGSLRSYTWPLPGTQSLGSVPTGSCLHSRYCKTNRWVPFTHSPCAFQFAGVFAGLGVESHFAQALYKQIFCPLQFHSFPGCISYWFSKPCVLGAHLYSEGSILTAQGKYHGFVMPPDCGLP